MQDHKNKALRYLKKLPLDKLVSVFLVGALLSVPAVSRGLLAAAPKGALSRAVVFGLLAMVLYVLADELSKSVVGKKAAQGARDAGAALSQGARDLRKELEKEKTA